MKLFVSSKNKSKYARPKENKIINNKILVIYSGLTEDIYFNSFKHKYGKRLSNVDIKLFNFKHGSRAAPLTLVNEAITKKDKYNEVWVVFDKDNFPCFDEAIAKAKRHGLNCAFSNIELEYFFLLYFSKDSITKNKSSSTIIQELTRALGITYLKSKAVLQNACNLLDSKGNIINAEELAQRGHEWHKLHSGKTFSNWCSCTTVYLLTRKFRSWYEANE